MAGLLATAMLLGGGTVTRTLEIPGNFANLAAAATTDPAVTACSIAYAVVDSCYSASPGLSTAAESDVANCICCHSTVEIDEYYGSCADYIASSYPRSSTQYSAFAGLARACASEVPTCGVGSASATATRTASNTAITTRTTATATGGGVGGGSSTDVPDACSSFQGIISSCVDATPAITAAPNSVAASCVCYATTRGTSSYNTDIDELASSCAPWAKSNAPASVYSAVVAFEDFCESFSPTTTRTRTSSTSSPTETDSESTTPTPTEGGGFGGGGGSDTATPTPTNTRATATVRSGNAAPQGGAGGLVLWTAEMFSAVLSFFFLM